MTSTVPQNGSASAADVGAPAVLAVSGLCAGYGDIKVLHDIELSVRKGSVSALLGPNGAGKTTLLRAISGLIRTESGTVAVGGRDVSGLRTSRRVRSGLCLVPEGRGVFPGLTVAENLRMAAVGAPSEDRTALALDAFPDLKDRLRQRAGTMSGGQQQMLALCRCFLTEPSVVLLDEVSIGLAPRIVEEIFVALRRLADTGIALVIVEQYIQRALELADEVHLISRGRLTFSGSPAGLTEESLMSGYLGVDLEASATDQQ
jgi:branched-chain amino acid transport system ATP-binding protein